MTDTSNLGFRTNDLPAIRDLMNALEIFNIKIAEQQPDVTVAEVKIWRDGSVLATIEQPSLDDPARIVFGDGTP
jgi:hypothetical protein